MNITGLWIPLEILTDEKLNRTEKETFSLILCLCNNKNICYLSNSVLNKYLNISNRQASRTISNLKKKNYIDIKIIRKDNTKEILRREIIPMKNIVSIG